MVIPYSTSNMAGVNFKNVYTAPLAGAYNYGTANPDYEVGTVADGRDGSKWVYVKVGTGGITARGYACIYDEDFLAVMASNSVGATGDKLGVFGGDNAALINDYCWLQVYGTCDELQVLASCAANVLITTTVTAGALDDAAGVGTKTINGIWLTTARAASQGNAPAELNWPVVGITN